MMTSDRDGVQVAARRSPLRLGLMVAGGAMLLAGGGLLIEELTDLLRGRADLDETFGALVAIAVGMTVLAAGALLRGAISGSGDAQYRLGGAFAATTGGVALLAAAGAFGLGVLVDLGTAGSLAVAVGVLLGVPAVGGLLAGVVDRRWGIVAGVGATAVLVGVGVVAALVAAVAFGAEIPGWVGVLDD